MNNPIKEVKYWVIAFLILCSAALPGCVTTDQKCDDASCHFPRDPRK